MNIFANSFCPSSCFAKYSNLKWIFLRIFICPSREIPFDTRPSSCFAEYSNLKWIFLRMLIAHDQAMENILEWNEYFVNIYLYIIMFRRIFQSEMNIFAIFIFPSPCYREHSNLKWIYLPNIYLPIIMLLTQNISIWSEYFCIFS